MNLNTKKIGQIILLTSSLFTISYTTQAETPENRANNKLDSNINQLLASENLPGRVMLVRKNNKIIHHEAYGYADIESQKVIYVV